MGDTLDITFDDLTCRALAESWSQVSEVLQESSLSAISAFKRAFEIPTEIASGVKSAVDALSSLSAIELPPDTMRTILDVNPLDSCAHLGVTAESILDSVRALESAGTIPSEWASMFDNATNTVAAIPVVQFPPEMMRQMVDAFSVVSAAQLLQSCSEWRLTAQIVADCCRAMEMPSQLTMAAHFPGDNFAFMESLRSASTLAVLAAEGFNAIEFPAFTLTDSVGTQNEKIRDSDPLRNVDSGINTPSMTQFKRRIVLPPVDITAFFVLLMSRPHCDAFMGDLEERHASIVETEGSRKAAIWFWMQVVQSLLSLALDALKRLSGLEKLYGQIGS